MRLLFITYVHFAAKIGSGYKNKIIRPFFTFFINQLCFVRNITNILSAVICRHLVKKNMEMSTPKNQSSD